MRQLSHNDPIRRIEGAYVAYSVGHRADLVESAVEAAAAERTRDSRCRRAELDWSFSSTRKTLDRMLDKQMVALQVVHGVNVYSARLEKVGTLAAFAHDFGRRVMEIDAPLPVTMFTGSKLVDQQELAQLEQMLHDWPADEA
jgi:predicted transcriptional regulator